MEKQNLQSMRVKNDKKQQKSASVGVKEAPEQEYNPRCKQREHTKTFMLRNAVVVLPCPPCQTMCREWTYIAKNEGMLIR